LWIWQLKKNTCNQPKDQVTFCTIPIATKGTRPGSQSHHGAVAVAQGREHVPLHSEVRLEGAQVSGGELAPERAGSRWYQAGSPPSGARHGHCPTF